VKEVLFGVFVLFANQKPVPHALIQCAEIGRQVDEQNGDSDLDVDGNGAVLTTDSRGFMAFTAYPGKFHCHAWKGDLEWRGELPVTKQATFSVVIRKP